MQDTFVTPVFNGSTDLRQAAGQMIEETAKAARRKKEMNDEFVENLYRDMTSLYHLDQIKVTGDGENEIEGGTVETPIAFESKVLLAAIVVIWILIGAFRLRESRKEKVKQQRR